jgi:hypothetical protein
MPSVLLVDASNSVQALHRFGVSQSGAYEYSGTNVLCHADLPPPQGIRIGQGNSARRMPGNVVDFIAIED